MRTVYSDDGSFDVQPPDVPGVTVHASAGFDCAIASVWPKKPVTASAKAMIDVCVFTSESPFYASAESGLFRQLIPPAREGCARYVRTTTGRIARRAPTLKFL